MRLPDRLAHRSYFFKELPDNLRRRLGKQMTASVYFVYFVGVHCAVVLVLLRAAIMASAMS